MNNTLKEYLLIALKGMAMGAADVIPGVSGGTIAFISGIYNRLVSAIANVDAEAIRLLLRWKWKKLIEKIDGFFLIAVTAGILTSVFSFANLVKFLLESYPEAVWAFFFGLVVASAVVIALKMQKWNAANLISLSVGIVLAFWLTFASLIQTPHTLPYIFGAGVIAIIAMILPGISGSFILVILDKYKFILDVVSGIGTGFKKIISGIVSGDFNAVVLAWDNMDILSLLVFWCGTFIGIIAFAKVLKWLLKNYHDITISLLIGFMIGSLNKVWPWQLPVQWYTDNHGSRQPLVNENVLPTEFNGYFFLCIGLTVTGYFAVYYLEKFSSEKEKSIQ